MVGKHRFRLSATIRYQKGNRLWEEIHQHQTKILDDLFI